MIRDIRADLPADDEPSSFEAHVPDDVPPSPRRERAPVDVLAGVDTPPPTLWAKIARTLRAEGKIR